VDGPSFGCQPSGLVIRHIEGPLAGQQQYFPDGVETITFGRPPQKTDVAYPRSYTRVGRLHLLLNRNPKKPGIYSVELTPEHYVEINGVEANEGMLVPSGGTFRLGDEDGPTFSVAIERVEAGEVTEIKRAPTPVRKVVQQQGRELEWTKKIGTYALGALTACLLIVAGWVTYRDFRYEQALVQITADLAAADAKVSKLAKKDIPQEAQDALQAAVYLVAKLEDDEPVGQATAWAFEPDKLATNAHVTEAIKGHEKDFILIGPNKERITIDRVESHPGYLAFKNYKDVLGRMEGDKFEPLNVINEYDVGIIHPAAALPADPETGKPATLELATKEDLEALKPGAPVASVGFPIEGLVASLVVTEAPSQLRFGNISSLTDVFMCKAEPEHRLLIQHTVPVAGGVSGSPLIDQSGKVIGIVNGGNTAKVLKAAPASKADADVETDAIRIPSAALINFAQRVDLLKDMLDGDADQELASDQDYWKLAAKKFASYFEAATKAFIALAAERYGVSGATRQELAKGTLKPRKAGAMSFASATHSKELEPGHLYGFIADAESGVRIALNVKKQGTAEFLRDEKDPRKTSVPELAPTAWVTVKERTPVDIDVLGMTEQTAAYALYVYDWTDPTEIPAGEASAEAKQ
jgi:hypothetical protein